MLLVCAQIPYELVSPSVWQRGLNVPPRRGKTKTEHKRGLREMAQRLWPSAKVTSAEADAALMAEWLRRKQCQ